MLHHYQINNLSGCLFNEHSVFNDRGIENVLHIMQYALRAFGTNLNP